MRQYDTHRDAVACEHAGDFLNDARTACLNAIRLRVAVSAVAIAVAAAASAAAVVDVVDAGDGGDDGGVTTLPAS